MKILLLVFLFVFTKTAAAQVGKLPDGQPVFDEVEQKAEFPGGYPALSNYFKTYFPIPTTSHVRTWAIVRATIDEQGFVQKIEILENPGGTEIEQKIRLAVDRMPRWQAAVFAGGVVASRVVFPVRFCVQ